MFQMFLPIFQAQNLQQLYTPYLTFKNLLKNLQKDSALFNFLKQVVITL